MKVKNQVRSCVLLLLSFVFISTSFSQNTFKVSGKVTDDAGRAVSGASVLVKGTTIGTTTGTDGGFELNAPSGKSVLIISSVGYTDQEIDINNRATINVSLATSASTTLEDVVVVGYGTRKKSDVTGSVAGINQKDIRSRPVTNALQAMQGKVAGVDITSNERPGQIGSINIRGVRSLTASNTPLFVVDGIPLTTGGIDYINPNDIESIDVLKDASATAIFGSRGANGVVIVTTKQGKAGKLQLSFNTSVTTEKIVDFAPSMSAAEAIEFRRWAYHYSNTAAYPRGDNPTIANDKVIFAASADPAAWANIERGWVGGKWDGSKVITTDWKGLVSQRGLTQDHTLSVSGGTNKMKAYASFGYLNNKGTSIGQKFTRYSSKASVDIQATDWFSMGINMNVTQSVQEFGQSNGFIGSFVGSPATSIYESARRLYTYAVPYDATGARVIYPGGDVAFKNVVEEWKYNQDQRKTLRAFGSLYAQVDFGGIHSILKGLKYRLNAGTNYITTRYGYYEGRDFDNQLGYASVSSSETNSWVLENILTYTKDFGMHHLDFTGVYSSQQRSYFKSATDGSGFINDELSFYNIGAATTVSGGFITNDIRGSYRDKYNIASQMGRINYSYNSKYLLTVTARRDGSSVMGANTTKYGLFPSVALGWNISRENFMNRIEFINNLKIRSSYGVTGNEAITVYQTITTDASVRYPFTGVGNIGVVASNLGNANLHWESSKTFNVGIDFAILKNRINGTVDWYQTNTVDILLRRSLPIITGYSFVWDNLGKTQNRGIEVMINSDNVVTKHFKWSSSANFSANKNKLVELYGDGKNDVGNRWYLGHPISIIYDYKMVGVWQVGEDASGWDPGVAPGSLKFADINGDKKIDANDRTILGQTAPKWIGGLTNTFQYKDFSLNIFIQTFQGALKNNVTLTYADEAGRMNIPQETGYWTATNKSNTRPALSYTNTRGYGYASDNSYTRIKDVTFSYNFPKEVLEKIKLTNLTVYASGRNLYTFTNWIGWDPEHNYSFRGSGDWSNNYPITRQIVFGVNVTLR